MDYLFIIPYLLGFVIAYGLIYWRYNKELNVRLKWMQKKLKKGRWKIPVAIFFILNLAVALTRTIFSIIDDRFLIKPFLYSFFLLFFFMLFFFKYFYEIIGGKREWKL